MRKIVLLCLSLYSFLALGQKDSTKHFCDPKLEGQARSKGFYITYERGLDADIESESTDSEVGKGSATIRRNNKIDIVLRAPIWNRPGFKVVLGIRYFYEELEFKTPEGLNYGLYRNLQDKNLKVIGTNLNVFKPLDEEYYMLFRGTLELNGDYSADQFPKSSFMKYSVAALLGWKKCPTRTTGVGLYYSNTFGRRSLYPVLFHNNTFNRKWGLEALVPIDVKIRRNISEKTLLYMGYEIQGNAYHVIVDNPPLHTYSNLELRRSNLRFYTEFDQEIHDWLWFGITAGLQKPLGFDLAKEPGVRKNELITSKIKLAPYFNFSVFIVPPRTLENRLLNARPE